MGEIPKTADKDTEYPHPRECGFDRQCIFGGAHLELYGEPKAGAYTPELMHNWALRFLDDRKGQPEPFFLYYASPIPHDPILPTPLNPDGKKRDGANFPYLIEYLDKQVGEIVSKLVALGLRKNTLVVFSGDNGTDRVSTAMRDGRVIKGGKHAMLDTGCQVPLIANWPGKIAPDSVHKGLVDFTDLMPTLLELAGLTAQEGIDGISFAQQLLGNPGKSREWVHTLFVNKYFVRDASWKLRENGELYDVTGAPYTETLVPPESDTSASRAAREHLNMIMTKLHPDKPAEAGKRQKK